MPFVSLPLVKSIIKQRLKVYHKNNSEIVEYYSSGERYNKIIGDGSPKDTMTLAAKIILEHAEKVIKAHHKL